MLRDGVCFLPLILLFALIYMFATLGSSMSSCLWVSTFTAAHSHFTWYTDNSQMLNYNRNIEQCWVMWEVLRSFILNILMEQRNYFNTVSNNTFLQRLQNRNPILTSYSQSCHVTVVLSALGNILTVNILLEISLKGYFEKMADDSQAKPTRIFREYPGESWTTAIGRWVMPLNLV